MNVIWKFPLNAATNKIDLPRGAKIVSVGLQEGDIQLWAACDPHLPVERRTIRVVGTGWELPENYTYLGMVQVGPYVWHVLEILPSQVDIDTEQV